MDDSVHEEDEEFRLVLGTPKSKSSYGASVGEQKEALITVTDEKDSTYSINNETTKAEIAHLFQGRTTCIIFD